MAWRTFIRIIDVTSSHVTTTNCWVRHIRVWIPNARHMTRTEALLWRHVVPSLTLCLMVRFDAIHNFIFDENGKQNMFFSGQISAHFRVLDQFKWQIWLSDRFEFRNFKHWICKTRVMLTGFKIFFLRHISII